MAHNGGRSQINFWALEYGNLYPFINHLKAAYGWGTNLGMVDPDTLDTNGYPLALTAWGAYHCVCGIPDPSNYSGNWILDWIGNGTLSIGTDVTTVSGSLSGTNGTYTFTNNQAIGAGRGDNFSLAITAIGSPRITQIRLYRADHATNLASGEIWNPYFLAKLRAANPGVLRFMDWTATNGSTIIPWAQRKATTHITYGGSSWISSLWAGSTGGTGNAFTVTKSGFSLVDKAQLIIRFNRNGTGVSGYTLNVQSTGAKPLQTMGGSTTAAGPTPPNDFFGGDQPGDTTLGLVTYDADLGIWQLTGGNTDHDQGIVGGVPPELCVDLCNQIGAHPWFNIPVYACDPLSDYTSSLATYCRDNLASGLVPRFEPINEVWNTFTFKSTAYSINKSKALWATGAGDADNWYNKVCSLMGAAISAVYSGDRSRYQQIFGLHTTSFGGTSVGGFTTERFGNGKYVTVNGGTPASAWVTHAAITNYWFSTYTSAELTTAGDNYVGGNSTQKATEITNYLNSAYGTTGPLLSNGIPYLKNQMSAWAAECAGKGIILTCYEGGWGSDDFPTTNARTMHLAAWASSLLNSQYTDVYNTYIADGGVNPSQYVMCGSGGLTILSPDIYATAGSPGWDAITTFNATSTPSGPVTTVPLMLTMRLRLHA